MRNTGALWRILEAALPVGAAVLAGCGGMGANASSTSTLELGIKSSGPTGPADQGVAALAHAYALVDNVTALTRSGWITVMRGPAVKIDLLALGAASTQLGVANLASDKISELQLHVDTAKPPYVVDAMGRDLPLKIPSGDQGGIKVNGTWNVASCETAHLDFDVDGKRSIAIHPEGHDLFVLRPVIRVAEAHTAKASCVQAQPPAAMGGAGAPGTAADPGPANTGGGNVPGQGNGHGQCRDAPDPMDTGDSGDSGGGDDQGGGGKGNMKGHGGGTPPGQGNPHGMGGAMNPMCTPPSSTPPSSGPNSGPSSGSNPPNGTPVPADTSPWPAVDGTTPDGARCSAQSDCALGSYCSAGAGVCGAL